MQHKRSGWASALQRSEDVGSVPPAPRALVIDHVFFLNFSRYGQASPAALTVLRDPVARYASQWAFWRAPAVLGAALRRARNATLAECAAAALSGAESPRFGCPPANYNTRYLCGRNDNPRFAFFLPLASGTEGYHTDDLDKLLVGFALKRAAADGLKDDAAKKRDFG